MQTNLYHGSLCRRKCEKNTVESAHYVHYWPVRWNTISIIGHIHKKLGGDILADGSVDFFRYIDINTPKKAAANTLPFAWGG